MFDGCFVKFGYWIRHHTLTNHAFMHDTPNNKPVEDMKLKVNRAIQDF